MSRDGSKGRDTLSACIKLLRRFDMKRKILLLLIILGLFSASSIYAALWDPYVYCVQVMGYAEETTDDGQYCVFPDGERCEMAAFYRGDCGQEYAKKLLCIKSGGGCCRPGEKCCEGLKAIERSEWFDKNCNRKEEYRKVEGGVQLGICSPCGNGRCDSHENHCNCPEDCKPGPRVAINQVFPRVLSWYWIAGPAIILLSVYFILKKRG